MRICRSCRRPHHAATLRDDRSDGARQMLREAPPVRAPPPCRRIRTWPERRDRTELPKAVGGSNGHGVQTGHEADSHGRERELGKGPRPAGQTAQPPVRPPGGEQCGTRSGREQDAEAAGVSVRIGIVVQEQQDEQELRVEFTGLGVACPGVALSCRKAALPAIQCRCKHKRQCGKGEVYGNPHHR